jgi:uncharacterized membrane protein YdjX (TVP38/TMEM64 family)
VQLRRIAVALVCLASVAGIYASGALDVLADPGHLRELAATHESTFGAAYVLALTVVSGLGIPGIVFMVPAPLVFSKWTAFWLGMTGGVAGSYVSYALARYVLRDYATARFGTRFASWNERLEKNALVAVLTMRLMFFLLPPVSFAIGLTRVRTVPFLVGTTLGAVPWVLFISFVGGSFLDWLTQQPPWVYGGIAVAAVLSGIAFGTRDKLAALAARVTEARASIAE